MRWPNTIQLPKCALVVEKQLHGWKQCKFTNTSLDKVQIEDWCAIKKVCSNDIKKIDLIIKFTANYKAMQNKKINVKKDKTKKKTGTICH